MRTLTPFAFSCSIALLILLPSGCGGDEEPISVTTALGDSGPGATGGTGAEGGSGGGGTGGDPTTGGSGGSPGSCDPATCPPLNVMTFSLPGCCATATTCGIDTSSVAGLLMGAIPSGCIDIASLAPEGGVPLPADAGGVSVIVDGGVVTVPGGDDIHLDPACPGVEIQNQFMPFSAAGCCTPDNFCGGSTHEIVIGGLPLSLGCYRNAEFGPLLDTALGFPVSGFVTIPPDPNQACTYAVEPPPPPPEDGGGNTPEAGPAPTDGGTTADATGD